MATKAKAKKDTKAHEVAKVSEEPKVNGGTIKCPICKGDGEIVRFGGIIPNKPCPMCRGKGKIEITNDDHTN